MDEIDVLEWTDMIEAEYIQESYEMHRDAGKIRHIVKWWYYAGMAAGLAITILSGSLLAIGGLSGGSEGIGSGDLGTALNKSGNILVGVLFLALAATGVFLYMIISAKRGRKNNDTKNDE